MRCFLLFVVLVLPFVIHGKSKRKAQGAQVEKHNHVSSSVSDVESPEDGLARVVNNAYRQSEGEMLDEHMPKTAVLKKKSHVEKKHKKKALKKLRKLKKESKKASSHKKRSHISTSHVSPPMIHEQTLPQAFGEADIDENGKDLDDDGDDSGSGSGDDDVDDEADKVAAKIEKKFEKIDPEEKRDELTPAKSKPASITCHRKCTTPMTYAECAVPRCDMKVGAVKDLCYFLCKHQRERCEEVCEYK